jgi:hypothetical protein
VLKHTLESVSVVKPRVFSEHHRASTSAPKVAKVAQVAQAAQVAQVAQVSQVAQVAKGTNKGTLRRITAKERQQLDWKSAKYWNNFNVDNEEYKRLLSVKYSDYLDSLPKFISGDTNNYKFKNKENKVVLNNSDQLCELVKYNPSHIVLSERGTQKLNELADSGISEAKYLIKFIKWLETNPKRGGKRTRKYRSTNKRNRK